MAVTAVPAAILTWARRPGSAALLRTARQRVETGRSGPGTRLTVAPDHRGDVGRMLGVTWELSGKAVTLGALGKALEGADTTLEDVLVATGGPLRNAAVEKAQARDATARRRDHRAAVLSDAGIPDAVVPMALRWLGGAEQADVVAEQVARAWAQLPARALQGTATGSVGLPVFASTVLSDPHALDRDRAAGRAMARVLAATQAGAALDGVPHRTPWTAEQLDAASGAAKSALSARAWRSAWAQAGVLCDQVSSMVLVLNLPLTGQNPALEAVSAIAGEPLWLTSRMTADGCAVAVPERLVRVCENPSVVEAAAAELGESCPPLVCLYGRPSSAAWDVLAAVVEAGGTLFVSGDRDSAGRQIVAEVAAAYPAGRVAEWLPRVEGRYEEQRLTHLLGDLR